MPSTWGLNAMSCSWNEAVKKLSDLDDVLRKFNDQVVCPRKDRVRPFQDLEFRALHIDFDESDPGDFRADTIERVGADERGNRPIRPHGGCEPVNALRPSVAPKGYFLGEADTQSPREESISIIIRSPAIPVEISTLSFKPLGSAICENRCVIRGTASLFATHLALEISSYLHSKGYDAIVITPVMWDYSK